MVDFGIAGSCQGVHTDTNKPGSLKYIPPEVIKNYKDVVAPAWDIWAMGVILFTLVCGTLPFNGKTLKEITTAITKCNPRIPLEQGVRISFELRNLLGCLITYPEYRITMGGIKQHPWIKGTKIFRYYIFFFRYNSSKRSYRRRRKINRNPPTKKEKNLKKHQK